MRALIETKNKGCYWPEYAMFQKCTAQNIFKSLEFIIPMVYYLFV